MEPARLPLIEAGSPRSAIVARPYIAQLRAAGYTPRQVAFRLNAEGIATPTGRGQWWPTTVEWHLHPELNAERMRRYRARRYGP